MAQQFWIYCVCHCHCFCTSNRDTSAKELSTLFLQQYAFLYPNPDEINKDETFRSAFILELLATAHLYHTLGHADVPALDTDNLAQGGFVGALGLCAVSVHQCLMPVLTGMG